MARRGGVAREASSSSDIQQELKAAFSLFSEGKEKLDSATLDKTLKKFGVKGDAKAMIKEADVNNEGAIDFLSFSAMMAKKMANSDSEQEIREAFQKFDWRKSGDINAKEISDALTNLGSKPLTTRELQEFLGVCEKEGGVVKYNEFITQMFGSKAQN